LRLLRAIPDILGTTAGSSLHPSFKPPPAAFYFVFIHSRVCCRTELALAELNTMSDHAVHDVCSSIGTMRHLALPEQALFESAKVQKLLQLLEELLPAGHRILLFSQWTQILDVLQDALQAKSYSWCRLDGGSKVEDRQSIIDEFNTNTSIGVFLISTRAGGVGINLTSADTVIIHDVDFNPQIDKQAQDRCHRVGQTKPVTVYRLVAVGTVDESVFECALRKEALANDALSGTNDNESAPDKKEETREILRAMMQARPQEDLVLIARFCCVLIWFELTASVSLFQAVRQNFSETLAP
jgi:SWI/SNF-related matrix-associated actin-dependent regulator 1 of chromatin subfamily A